jgi:hypothetical protein
MSDFRYEIVTELKLRYLLSDMKTSTEKSGSVRTQRTHTTDSSFRGLTSGFPDPGSCRPQWETVQVDLVEVEVPGPQTSGPPTDNAI